MKAVSVVLLAGMFGCAALQPVLAAEGSQESVIYSFSGTDGETPWANLINVHGTLYGTTVYGGATGYGTVFALDPSTGQETELYSFCHRIDCTDGRYPYAALTYVKGKLYGTTSSGGNAGQGTVFAFDPSNGKERVIRSFYSSIGSGPIASMINVKGTLYGTTGQGGAAGYGAVFTFDPKTGAENVIYSFCSQTNCPDGSDPHANLIDVNGTLYGTTGYGGGANKGVVFSLDPSTGTETTLYSFCSQTNCTDGANPYVGLTNVNGTLYGATSYGGAADNGTVFTIDPSTGAETVVYSFCSQSNCTDGSSPYGSLIDVKGTLYGTTIGGGVTGYGAVFSLDPSTNAETVVYSFCSQTNCTDGKTPDASLISVKGTLYTTTLFGGAANDGTAVAITP